MDHGSLCALVTPFTADDDLDLEALCRLLDWHLSAGTSAVVLAGSTGESMALDEAELATLWRTARAHVGSRLRLLAGTGQPSTRATIARTALAAECGMDAALVVTPAYVRPTQRGLLAHYREVAGVGLPLMLYNVPARTACDLLPETVAELAGLEPVAAIKEALPDMARIDALLAIRSVRPDFAVLSGDDPTAAAAIARGADGVVSVTANVVPAAMARLVEALRSGDPRAAELATALQPLHQALALESNPIPAKAALHRLGRIGPSLRLPLQPLADRHLPALEAAMSPWQGHV